MRIVLDSSAVLAALLNEPGEDQVFAVRQNAILSAVNLAEVIGRLNRRGSEEAQIRAALALFAFPIIPADEPLAWDAAILRAQTDIAGLSLGDRFCLALARRFDAPVLTADRAWAKVAEAVGVDIRLIR